MHDRFSCSSFGLLCFWQQQKRKKGKKEKSITLCQNIGPFKWYNVLVAFVITLPLRAFNTESNTIEIETETLLLCIYCSVKLTYRVQSIYIDTHNSFCLALMQDWIGFIKFDAAFASNFSFFFFFSRTSLCCPSRCVEKDQSKIMRIAVVGILMTRRHVSDHSFVMFFYSVMVIRRSPIFSISFNDL